MSGINVNFKTEYKSYKPERIAEMIKNLLTGMGKAVLVVERQAKEDCPVDTGRLRASLTSKVETSKDEIIGTVGTNVEYGAPVELGTPRRPATPYLFPALEKNKDKIKELLKG